MKKSILPLLFCVSLTCLVYGQNLVEPAWRRFTGAPPEEVVELSRQFGLSFDDLRIDKPNLNPVIAAAKDQYHESTVCDIDGSIVTMTAVYYIDEQLGYYASTLVLESNDNGFISDQFACWEKLISDTLEWGYPSVTIRFPGTILSWLQRNRWPAFTISRPSVTGTMHRISFSQYSQFGMKQNDPVNHEALVRRLTNDDTTSTRPSIPARR
jgi:hypothetical protein